MSRTSGKRRQICPNRRLWNLGQRSKVRTRRFRWLRTFPFKLFLGILCFYIGFELFTLPFLSIANLDIDNPKKTALMQQRREEASEQGKKLAAENKIAGVPTCVVYKHGSKVGEWSGFMEADHFLKKLDSYL